MTSAVEQGSPSKAAAWNETVSSLGKEVISSDYLLLLKIHPKDLQHHTKMEEGLSSLKEKRTHL